jgi:pimeloyl-ACP methyl ester carboxylesterase
MPAQESRLGNTAGGEFMSVQFPDFPPGLERVEIDGVELHYLALGQGFPVVLVHGGADDLRYWEAQIGPLAERFRVITYSRRHSAPNNNPIASAEHSALIEADDLSRLIDKLGVKQAHVIGHSYGAFTALALILRRPELARTLTLSEPPMLGWADQVDGGEALVRGFMDDAVRPAGEAFRRNDPAAFSILFDTIIGPGIFDGLPDAMRQRILCNAREMEALCISRNPFPALPLDAVRQLRVPTLLLTGDRTTPINTIGLKVLDRLLPNHELRLIPDATHELFVENPEASNTAVLAFLDKH